MTRLACSLTIALGLVAAVPAFPAQDTATKPDNTKVNKKDRDPNEATADRQSNNKSDSALTKEIRQAVIADKSLSTYAHNIKIVARNGTVTLKGPVQSEDEKKTIVAKATEVAGASNVKDEITVKQ